MALKTPKAKLVLEAAKVSVQKWQICHFLMLCMKNGLDF